MTASGSEMSSRQTVLVPGIGYSSQVRAPSITIGVTAAAARVVALSWQVTYGAGMRGVRAAALINILSHPRPVVPAHQDAHLQEGSP